MSDALSCAVLDGDVLSWAEIDGQQAELLPARTVLSTFGSHSGWADWGGGDLNVGGTGQGGQGGDALAVVADNNNYGLVQINIAIAFAGDGGDGYGGDVDTESDVDVNSDKVTKS